MQVAVMSTNFTKFAKLLATESNVDAICHSANLHNMQFITILWLLSNTNNSHFIRIRQESMPSHKLMIKLQNVK